MSAEPTQVSQPLPINLGDDEWLEGIWEDEVEFVNSPTTDARHLTASLVPSSTPQEEFELLRKRRALRELVKSFGNSEHGCPQPAVDRAMQFLDALPKYVSTPKATLDEGCVTFVWENPKDLVFVAVGDGILFVTENARSRDFKYFESTFDGNTVESLVARVLPTLKIG